MALTLRCQSRPVAPNNARSKRKLQQKPLLLKSSSNHATAQTAYPIFPLRNAIGVHRTTSLLHGPLFTINMADILLYVSRERSVSTSARLMGEAAKNSAEISNADFLTEESLIVNSGDTPRTYVHIHHTSSTAAYLYVAYLPL